MAYDIGPKIGIDGEAEFRKAIQSINTNIRTLGTEMLAVTSAYDANDKSAAALASRNGVLTKQIEAQREKLTELQKGLEASTEKYGENDAKTQRWQQTVNVATAELNRMERQLASSSQELETHGSVLDGLKGKLSAIGSGLATAAKAGAAAVAAASAAVGVLVKQSVAGYGEFEQLAGGVETLFKDSAGIVTDYANSAYKTAGLSANAYMETVTGFSASLLQSLGGDTEKAAQVADQAITDMADNANKMGTSMESIQNAYQGFAKQNYTMLDNLKLGYGGTKEEMQRLLSDAEKLSGQKFDLSSYADIVEAIHVVQTEMGITGTTAKEAATTIQGSVGAAKSAWQNLVVGIADENADLSGLIGNFTDSVGTAAQNILPRITQILSGIGSAIQALAPVIAQQLPAVISGVLPSLADAGAQLTVGLAAGLVGALPSLMEAVPGIVETIASAISENLPALSAAGTQILEMLADGILAGVPAVMTALPGVMTSIVDFLAGNGPEFLLVGAEFIAELARGIIDAIPDMVGDLPQVVEAAVSFLLEQLPVFLEQGAQLLGSLAMGIIEALPELIESVVQAVSTILQTLGSNFPKLVEKGTELLKKLISGILGALPELGTAAAKIVSTVQDGLAILVTSVVGVGKNIIKGLWNGISDMAGWIAEKIQGFGKNVLDSLKNFFGIHSPSELMRREVGQYIGLGVAEGISGSSDEAVKAAGELAEDVYSQLNAPEVGLSFTNGIASGIQSGMSAVTTAASQAASAMRQAVQGVTGNAGYGAELAAVQGRTEQALAQMAVAGFSASHGAAVQAPVQTAGGGNSGGDIASAVRAGLSGAAVYMDGRKVGRMVTARQDNDNKAWDR